MWGVRVVLVPGVGVMLGRRAPLIDDAELVPGVGVMLVAGGVLVLNA